MDDAAPSDSSPTEDGSPDVPPATVQLRAGIASTSADEVAADSTGTDAAASHPDDAGATSA
jgi:metal-dependent amidase/aminoacylase/carboxypeptidase family protein